MEIFYFLTKYIQSRLLQNCRMRERIKQKLISAFNLFFSITLVEEIDVNNNNPTIVALDVVNENTVRRVQCSIIFINSRSNAGNNPDYGKYKSKQLDVNPFPLTTNLQQSTLKTSSQKHGSFLKKKELNKI